MICRQDREILDQWAEHGIPDDQSTRAFAVDHLLLRLYADYRAIEAALDEVLALGDDLAAVAGQLTLEVGT